MQALVPVFEETVLPHLDAAYNLARWLTRDERDGEDVVQEAFLRALRHYRTFKGGDARPWLLAISSSIMSIAAVPPAQVNRRAWRS